MSAKHRNIPVFLLACLITVFGIAFAIDTANAEGNAGFGPGLQTPPPAQFKSLILKEELTIGSANGDENTGFGSYIFFTVDNDGNIYIADHSANVLRKFGPNGKFIKIIGRFGQGPGEFQSLYAMDCLKDGTLYIHDILRRRILYFSREDDFMNETELPPGISGIQISPQGTYLGQTELTRYFTDKEDMRTLYAIFDSQFKPIVELYTYIYEKQLAHKDDIPRAQRAAFLANHFIKKPSPIDAMAKDGSIYFGSNDKYSIDVYSPEGKKLNTIKRQCPPIAYDKKAKNFYLDRHGEGLKLQNYKKEEIEEIRGLIEFPKNKFFFSEIVPMDEGRLAVKIDQTSDSSSIWDIFDREGQFQGRVTAQFSGYSLKFKNGKAYCVHTDPEGYLSVKRYSYELK